MEFIITKVKMPLSAHKGKTVIKFRERHEKPICELPNTKEFKELRPHPDFRNKLQAFKTHLLRQVVKSGSIREMTDDKLLKDPEANTELNRLTVLSVEQKGTGEKATLTIEGRQSSHGGNPNTVKSGSILMDEEQSSYTYAEEMTQLWEELKVMAIEFINLKKYDVSNIKQDDPSQPQMFPKGDGDVPPQGEVVDPVDRYPWENVSENVA